MLENEELDPIETAQMESCEPEQVAPEAEAVVRDMLTAMTLSERLDFGNARGMRNTLEKLVQAQANRIAEVKGEITRDMLVAITEEDARAALDMPKAEEVSPSEGDKSAEAAKEE